MEGKPDISEIKPAEAQKPGRFQKLRAAFTAHRKQKEGINRQVDEAVEKKLNPINTALKEAKAESMTDGLTGLYNKRFDVKEGPLFLEEAKRHGQPFTLLNIDLDGMKLVNDEKGHQFGDLYLQAVARVLNVASRDADRAIRYGGDEFKLYLVQTNSQEGEVAAERLRVEINKELELLTGNADTSTVSIGVATFDKENVVGYDQLTSQADIALYQSKFMINEKGEKIRLKNRVTVYKPGMTMPADVAQPADKVA